MEVKRTNYILIDYENIRSLNLALLNENPVQVLVFVGEQQKRLPTVEVQKMLTYRGQIRLITMAGTGSNALDFHLAYYAGRISVEDPKAFIHFITKDKGFDPLVAHLKSQKIFAHRSDCLAEIPLLQRKETIQMDLRERAEQIITRLAKIAVRKRPRKKRHCSPG